MDSVKKVYYCKVCGKNDKETKFYDYLNTKCIICKRKKVKEARDNKIRENREEKIDNIDPDEKIRYLWSEMMKEPFHRNGKISILDFMQETEQDISELVLESEKNKSDCFASISFLREKINSFDNFELRINEIIDLRIEIALNKFKNELINKT